ncbi:MAG: hypothetical protein K940chlam5_00960 [Candidatus Anoxychlamydiales bacterium]|nr:hypothetical protein [Candidatus Anoxychlamydiales bacterium]
MSSQVNINPSRTLLDHRGSSSSCDTTDCCHSETWANCIMGTCCIGITVGLSLGALYIERINGIDSTLVKVGTVAAVCIFTLLAAGGMNYANKHEDPNREYDPS